AGTSGSAGPESGPKQPIATAHCSARASSSTKTRADDSRTPVRSGAVVSVTPEHIELPTSTGTSLLDAVFETHRDHTSPACSEYCAGSGLQLLWAWRDRVIPVRHVPGAPT